MRILPLVPLLALLACLPGPRRTGGPATAGAPAPTGVSRLKQLHWLEGKWRGSEDGAKPFYESYRVASDYLIEGHTWSDSTFRTATDTSLIQIQGEEIVTNSNAVAVELEDGMVRFRSRPSPSTEYTWTRVDADRWTAVITWTDTRGTPQRKTYFMSRVAE